MPSIMIALPRGAKPSDEIDYVAALQKLAKNIELDNLQALAKKSETVPDVNGKIRKFKNMI